MTKSFELGGVAISYEAGDGRVLQSYDDATRRSLMEMGDGSLVSRTYAGTSGKINTRISGNSAWAAAPLSGLDYSSAMTLKCAEPRAIHGATVSITIPSARRIDTGYTPRGYAVVGGSLVETTITGIVSNVCTLTAVSGATGYEVHYWPEITVHAKFTESLASDTAHYAWALECREA